MKLGNDLRFLIGNKMYCVAGLKLPLTDSFKVQPEEFIELTNKKGIILAPYVARYHWVLVEDLNALNLKEWKFYITQSYKMIFNKLSKKIQREINAKN